LLAALKAQSEVALGSSIDVVSVTAPAMAAWQNSIPVNSVVNDALVLAELEPWSWEASDPEYLGEANTVLAANGRRICKDSGAILTTMTGCCALYILSGWLLLTSPSHRLLGVPIVRPTRSGR
jgi:hypothetical protein